MKGTQNELPLCNAIFYSLYSSLHSSVLLSCESTGAITTGVYITSLHHHQTAKAAAVVKNATSRMTSLALPASAHFRTGIPDRRAFGAWAVVCVISRGHSDSRVGDLCRTFIIPRTMSSQSTRPKVLLSGALALVPCPNSR